MSLPTRQTAAGRAYLDLQNRARREKRTTHELLTLYVLERWLARLAASPYAGSFVLKGGLLLLAVFDARRPTADANRPTAIVAINDMCALGVCPGVRDAGLRVGTDVSVVGFDDIVLADLAAPR